MGAGSKGAVQFQMNSLTGHVGTRKKLSASPAHRAIGANQPGIRIRWVVEPPRHSRSGITAVRMWTAPARIRSAQSSLSLTVSATEPCRERDHKGESK